MHVLLMESNPGDADAVAATLSSSGHEVSRCHDREAPGFPCNGLVEDRRCPLEEHDVEAAILVRGATSAAGRSASEDGVRCALRRHIPVVLAGELEDSPYRDWASSAVTEVDDVLPAVEVAASAPLRRHERAASRSMRSVLEQHGASGADAEVDVRRQGGDLVVGVRAPIPLDDAAVETASVRVAGAVRDVDPYAKRISVTVHPGGA